MKKMFSYNKSGKVAQDTLVETFTGLVESYNEGKGRTAEYSETNQTFNNELMRYCVESIPNATFSLEEIRNPMVYNDVFFKHSFDTVLAQAIVPTVPTVISNNYNTMYDVTQVGFGDIAKYTVDSNELFVVNDMAEGIARGGIQTTYNTEYTVQTKRRQVSVFVDWYHVAAGKQDWGKFGSKIGLAFGTKIQSLVVTKLADVISSAANYGIAGFGASGAFSDTNFVTIARNVKLANGGADVYAMGTNLALANIMPAASATSGFRYGEDSAIVKTGFLPSYKNVPLYEIQNALKPNTINGNTVETVIPDDMIYFMAMGQDKPIKVAIEGQNVVVNTDPLNSADHCYCMTVDMRVGVDAIVGAKFGYMDM